MLKERRRIESDLDAALSNVETLNRELAELRTHSDNQRKMLAVLQAKMRDLKANQPRKSPTPTASGQKTGIDEISAEEASVATGIAVRAATDALRRLCRERSGAISHHEIDRAMNSVMKSLNAIQRQLFKAEMNSYGSSLAWAKNELRAMGRRVT